MKRAGCLDKDPEAFFPKKGESATDAKQICNSACKVRVECLIKALHDEKGSSRRFGVFGGLTPTERMKLQARLDQAGRSL